MYQKIENMKSSIEMDNVLVMVNYDKVVFNKKKVLLSFHIIFHLHFDVEISYGSIIQHILFLRTYWKKNSKLSFLVLFLDSPELTSQVLSKNIEKFILIFCYENAYCFKWIITTQQVSISHNQDLNVIRKVQATIYF